MIVKQIDADYAADMVVAFITTTATNHTFKRGETYNVELHRKPLDASGKAFRYCPHNHKSIDSAVRCAKRFIRERRAAGAGEQERK